MAVLFDEEPGTTDNPDLNLFYCYRNVHGTQISVALLECLQCQV